MQRETSAQEVFLVLPHRPDELCGYSPDLIQFYGPPGNSGEKYLVSRQGKVFSIFIFYLFNFFFYNQVERFSSFQLTPN